VAQVDFDETGTVMADMARMHPPASDGRQVRRPLRLAGRRQPERLDRVAAGSAHDSRKYANLKLVDIVYGNDQSEESYNKALGLVDKYPGHQGHHGPDHRRHRRRRQGHAGRGSVREGQGLRPRVCPPKWSAHSLNGCAPQFALWSFVDLGYLTYHVAYKLATGDLQGVEGETFEAGRMGSYTIEKDPHPRRRSARPDGAVHGL
jgi:rhamnose transport system substrate-binding protein